MRKYDMELYIEKDIDVRFSEVDSMGVVWHGAYPLYLEDAREAFGEKYGLTYANYVAKGYYAPIVDMQIQYKQPLRHETKIKIIARYIPTEAAKIIFEYEIRDRVSNVLYSTGKTIQVFMDLNYQLVWQNPKWFEEWKNKWQK